MSSRPPTRAEHAEQVIQRAQGSSRAPIRLRAGQEHLLARKREEMLRREGHSMAPPSMEGLKPTLGRIIWADERDKDGNPIPLGSELKKNPDLAAYGYDHASQCSKLAVVIAKHLGVGSGPGGATDLKVVEGVAMFHDLGRTRPWQFLDDHSARSAGLAEEAMRCDPTLWSDDVVRSEVCRMLVLHAPQGLTESAVKPTDPRLIAVWDADCMESVRLAPGTREGVVIMNKRMALCVTPWARKEENQRRWRDHRGGW